MVTATVPAETEKLYRQLEDRILMRDQVGASQAWYGLVKEDRPLPEMLRETIGVAAPYLQVPYHQRIDNGVMRFVNNDHCLLSASAALRLTPFVGKRNRLLPMAQTVWYVPTGLDPWNQLLGKIPGHYARNKFTGGQTFPMPTIHWPDQEPEHLEGPLEERLNHWLTLVQIGDVLGAYRVFLGLLEDEEDREPVWAHLVFAGLIDVQDRMYFNRSYTTGHRAHRARAVIELCDAIGWEDAHSVVFAGVPDLAVGPHWYSAYEMAGEVAWRTLAEPGERQKSSIAPTPELPPERRLLANKEPLSSAESEMLFQALIRQPEPAHIDAISSLLLAGKDPLAIIEVMQVAAAQLVLETGDPLAFSMPQHCAEYMNTLGWWFRRFNHPHKLKVLYVAGAFLAQTAHWLKNTPGNGTEYASWPPRDLSAESQADHLLKLDAAQVAKNSQEAVMWTKSYIAQGWDTKPLVLVLAMGAAKHGNDTHNQEIGLSMIEDYVVSRHPKRDRLLYGAAQHNAGHVKYGDSLEPYRRFMEAVGTPTDQRTTESDRDPIEAVLDDD